MEGRSLSLRSYGLRAAHMGIIQIDRLLKTLVWGLLIGLGGLSYAEDSPTEAQSGKMFGQQIYEKRCAHCHGIEGRGDGPAAERFRPPPANFARAKYKYASTQKDELPTDDDLFLTISRGLPGTGMPAWGEVLSKEEMLSVIQYIKTFSNKFAEAEAPPKKIAFGNKIASSAESIAKGKDLFFKKAECNRCHGDEGRADGKNAAELAVWPRNLTKGWTFRRTNAAEEIFQRITRGIIVMPSFAAGENVELTEEERWHIANYVHSLSLYEGVPPWSVTLMAQKIEGALPGKPEDPVWESLPPHEFPLVGQVTIEPRQFTPTVNSVTLKAAYNDKEVAFLVIWDDPTQSVPSAEAIPAESSSEGQMMGETDPLAAEAGDPAYEDAVALQFPTKLYDAAEKPYFLMGDAEHPVNLVKWNAGGRLEEIQASGQDQWVSKAQTQFTGSGRYKNGQYRLVLKRALIPQDASALPLTPGVFAPVAFTAWDGSNGDHDGMRSVSAWYHVLPVLPVPFTRYIYPTFFAGGVVLLEIWVVWAYRRRGKTGNPS